MEKRDNIFAAALQKESMWTQTENGARALNSTGEAVLDLFSVIGALRNADGLRIERLFEEAYREDPLLTCRTVFYARDIRGGLGERELFRKILSHAANVHPEMVLPNIHLIGLYGRFDDLYCLVDTPVENHMWDYMRSLFAADLELMEAGQPCSLLAKWIKTPDASSPHTRALGIKTAMKLGYSVYDFKRKLRALRKYLDIVEIKMSARKWAEINYSAVPSNAMMKHRKAFWKHDEEGMRRFIEAVDKGEVKINASTLFPYDLVEKILDFWNEKVKEDPVVEAQWKALPNYVEPGTNALVIADTSGSMDGRPMASALGLAVYFAERNTGAYHNLFMSFSSRSTVHELKGETLAQKLSSIDMSDWNSSTNLQAAFRQVLHIAVVNHIPKDEMVKSLIVITDMEIDPYIVGDWTFYDAMKAKYESCGYDIPNVVYWNVNSRHDVYHADSDRKGVQLVSGQSTSTFKQLVGGIGMTPVEMMLKVLNGGRYDLVTVEEVMQ